MPCQETLWKAACCLLPWQRFPPFLPAAVKRCYWRKTWGKHAHKDEPATRGLGGTCIVPLRPQRDRVLCMNCPVHCCWVYSGLYPMWCHLHFVGNLQWLSANDPRKKSGQKFRFGRVFVFGGPTQMQMAEDCTGGLFLFYKFSIF